MSLRYLSSAMSDPGRRSSSSSAYRASCCHADLHHLRARQAGKSESRARRPLVACHVWRSYGSSWGPGGDSSSGTTWVSRSLRPWSSAASDGIRHTWRAAFIWAPAESDSRSASPLSCVGAIGKVLCGRSVDALYRRGYRDAQFRWYAGCLLAAIPAGVIGTTSGHPVMFLVGIGIMVTLLQPLPACAYASMNLITPNELRGAGVALFNCTLA